MSGSNTESFGSVSSGGNSKVEVESQSDGEEDGSIPIHSVPGSLDAVDLLEVPTFMQSVPRFLRGAYKGVATSLGHHQCWRRTKRSVTPDEGLEVLLLFNGPGAAPRRAVRTFFENKSTSRSNSSLGLN